MDLITRPQVRDVPSDRRRALPVLLASAGYAFAGVTVPLLLFAGGWWLPKTVDAGPRLLWATGLTGYVLLGTFLEERDLVARFGAAYRAYSARVPACFPSPLNMPTEVPRA